MPTHGPLVVTLAYDGLSTFEFGCAVEVFGLPRPEMGPGWYRFSVAAVDRSPLRAVGGITVAADGELDLLDAAQTIVVPGWPGDETGPRPAPPGLVNRLRTAHERGARIVSLCSGAFLLAEAGLLAGRRATTHWWRHAERLAALHPSIRVEPDMLYVDEGSIMTSAGGAAALDLCLHIVRRDFGPDAANRVARRLVVPPHREGGQAQVVPRPVPSRPGARLAALLATVSARLGETWPNERLADEAAVSPRSLHRRFREATGSSPAAWLTSARVARARELLETTSLSIDEIAAEVGFRSAATMRLHFRERLGMAPGAWRARAGVRQPAAFNGGGAGT